MIRIKQLFCEHEWGIPLFWTMPKGMTEGKFCNKCGKFKETKILSEEK